MLAECGEFEVAGMLALAKSGRVVVHCRACLGRCCSARCQRATQASVVRRKFFGNVLGWGMPRTGRPKAELILTVQEREQLLRWSRRAKSSQASALRSRIVLGCAEGAENNTVATRLGCSANTVSKWRGPVVADPPRRVGGAGPARPAPP